jgi:hypothetical protein
VKKILFLFNFFIFVPLAWTLPGDPVIKEGMDRVEDWHVETDAGAQAQIRSVAGQDGNALELDFDFAQSQWVQVWKRAELNLQEAEFIKLVFQGTGLGNNLQIKLVDQDGSTFGTNLEGVLPTGSWSEVEVPLRQLQYFWGGDDHFNKEALRKIYVGATRAEGGKGNLILDAIQFSKTATGVQGSSTKPALDMNTSAGFTVGGESGTSSNLNVVEGHQDKALQIKYDFGTGTWLQLQKQVQWNLKDFNHLSFWYRTQGSVNNLQVKLVDRDGSTFGVTLEAVLSTQDWVEVKLPFNELNYFWGGDQQFDSSDVRKFFFAVTKNEGGAGSLELDEFQFLSLVLAQEKADVPEKGVERVLTCEGMDLENHIQKLLSHFSIIFPEGFQTTWGGPVTLLPQEISTGSILKESQDVSLEDVLLWVEISLERQESDEVSRLLDLVFSEKYFFDASSSWPVWLLDREGAKKSLPSEKSTYLSPSAEVLRLIGILNQSQSLIGNEKTQDRIEKLLKGLSILKKDGFILPLASIQQGKINPAQDRRTYLSGQDFWGFTGDAQAKILEALSKDPSPYGLFFDEIRWEDANVKTQQDPRQHESYLLGQLKIAIALSQDITLREDEKLSSLSSKLLEFLMNAYVADQKIVTSYDSMTGAPLCNFESSTIYAQIIRLSLLKSEYAFAETLIKEKILPFMVREGDFQGLLQDERSTGFWAQDQLQVLLALLKYQNAIKNQSDLKHLDRKIDSKRFLDQPIDVIDLFDIVDIDSLSELGKTEGNFDGVGFSFGASSFGPSRTFFMCLNKDIVFLVPPKEGQINNAVQCMGQEIYVEPKAYRKVHFLASAHHGNISDFIQLKYRDGTSDRLPFSVGDWWHKPKIGHIARECDLVQNGQKIRDRHVNLFHIEIESDSNKILESIVLPANGKAVIFSVTAEGKEEI